MDSVTIAISVRSRQHSVGRGGEFIITKLLILAIETSRRHISDIQFQIDFATVAFFLILDVGAVWVF